MRRLKPVKKDCIYCNEKSEPSYRDYERLARFITERGKIQPQSRLGTCRMHQRKLTFAIKHARHIALLPFIVRPYS